MGTRRFQGLNIPQVGEIGQQAPSKSQVNKAGKTLRSALRNEGVDGDAVSAALDVLQAWRSAHSRPLAAANMGLRSMLATEQCRVEVSQRLKRIPTIADKLLREPTMALGNMADIGGCRAVLDSLDELRRVESRVRHRRPPVQHHDYVRTPRATGYRAVHLIVEYSGRRIEIQLRTRVMHEWAYTVERFTGRLGHDIKGGRGPAEVVDWFQSVSEAMALEEQGQPVGGTLLDRIAMLRGEAEPYLRGGRL